MCALGLVFVYNKLTNSTILSNIYQNTDSKTVSAPAPIAPKTSFELRRQISFSAAISKVSPFVVNVYARSVDKNETVNSYGSGVIMSVDGYILTNNHVVGKAKDFAVTLIDGSVYKASLVGRDALTDLAVLKISPINNKLQAMNLPKGTSNVQVGDLVIAIGNPLNLGQSATMGIVSALGRATIDRAGYQQLIQTDVALNTGNSGGALINAQGEIVGINTLIINEAYGQQVSGLGFAIPTAEAQQIMEQIIIKGYAEHPYFGAQTTVMTDADSNNYLIISYLDPNGPAYKAGLQIGDRIISIDGLAVSQVNQFFNKLGSYSLGANVHLQVQRQGASITYNVKLASVNGNKVSIR